MPLFGYPCESACALSERYAPAAIAHGEDASDVLHRGAGDSPAVAVCDTATFPGSRCAMTMCCRRNGMLLAHCIANRSGRAASSISECEGHEQFAGDGRAMAGAYAAV
ncbi:hypothetical protein PSAB6_100013 [Paraburkholderia sabiae]|nr:hypothetical protein PSAB6_100013 [Paraburkholderia sabiae]